MNAAKKKVSKKKVSKKKVSKKAAPPTATKKTRAMPPVPEQIAGLDTSKLPAEVRAELRGARQNNTSMYIQDVLPAKGEEPADVNEIIVSVWNVHKQAVKRSSVLAALTALVARGVARRAGTGSYTKT